MSRAKAAAGEAPPPGLPTQSRPWTVRQVASKDKVLFAREQRREPTATEEDLWRRLRSGSIGYHFRRQHPLGGFVLDFYCAEVRVAVEVDGPTHQGREEYDGWRDQQLASLGLRTLRLSEAQVRRHPARALLAIRKACEAARGGGLTPDPSPCGRGERC